MKLKHIYLMHVWGDVEPSLLGPYDDEEARDTDALRIRHNSNEEPDGLYPVTLDLELENMCDGIQHKLSVDTYSGAFFDE